MIIGAAGAVMSPLSWTSFAPYGSDRQAQ